MALRAKKPETVEKRLKLFLFGDYGVGKTTAACSFPASYVIDAERGAENDSYVDLMKKNGSAILQTSDVDEIAQELRALVSEKHGYKTIVLDPSTKIEEDLMEKLHKKYPGENDMRIWRDRDQSMRRICNLLLKADMNVIVTAHGKVDYGPNMVKLGSTFDGWKRLPYLFDLVLELKRNGSGARAATVRKTRVANFKDGEEFPWSYEEFQKRYGAVLDKEAATVALATPEQVTEAKRLVEKLKVDEETLAKAHKKADAESFEEYPKEFMEKVIAHWQKIEQDNSKKGAI